IMKGIMKRFATGLTTLAFAAALAAPAVSDANGHEKAPLDIKVRVSEKGFFDEKGKPYGGKRLLQVPKDTMVNITFVFGEDLTSLAAGDTHQITVRAEDGWKQETSPLWMMNRESTVSFLAGEKGRMQYRAYCILDCIGMEHLTNLFIQVV
ncbi:MAG TPA: hypothetical protein PLZ37_14715, partial [Nitrospira sp.]|nr:hypothetical protein [Nitrospira sp.]